MMQIQTKILDQNLCIGCGLCAGLSDDIQMVEIGNSHYEPQFHSDPVQPEFEQTILNSCPGIHVQLTVRPRNRLEQLWGPMESVMIGHSTNDKLRFEASSGGAISALLICLLEQGAVDAVMHVGKSETNPLRNEVFVSTNADEVRKRSGSRYSPVAALSRFGEILKGDQKFAFVGKPCDVAAVRQYLRGNPQYAAKIPFLISFFCAGQPTFKATDRLLEKLETVPEAIEDFRYRGHGWPGQATAIRKDGSVSQCTYDESWGQVLGRDLHLRCRICPDAIGQLADIACADAWDCDDKGYPVFEERPGKSLIMTRNQTGNRWLELALKNGYLVAEDYDPAKLNQIQAYQAKRRSLVLPRMLALRLRGIGGFQFLGLSLFQNMARGNWRHAISNFWGTLRRLKTSKKNEN
jgi:coenzyme F420 hydrogenase subunit beta